MKQFNGLGSLGLGVRLFVCIFFRQFTGVLCWFELDVDPLEAAFPTKKQESTAMFGSN